MIRHLGRVFRKKGLPIYFTFFVTSRCNMACQHCFYWKELNTIKDELSLEEIKKLSDEIGNLAVLILTGGEPTLRKDLPEIAEIFYKNNKVNNLVIATNGYDTENIVNQTRAILERVKSNVIISLSLDGTKEVHNQIRGVDCYENVLKTFYQLKELKKEYKKLKVSICITLSELNQGVAKQAYEMVKDYLKPDNISLSVARGDTKGGVKDIDLNIYKELLDLMKEDKRGYDNITTFVSEEIGNKTIKIIEEKKQVMPCYAKDLNCVVYPNGDVHFCELLDSNLGNIREDSFKEIWYSEKANKLREDKSCFCIHDCNLQVNILFNPMFFWRYWWWNIKGDLEDEC